MRFRLPTRRAPAESARATSTAGRIAARWRRLARWKRGVLALGGLAGIAAGGIVAALAYGWSQSNSSGYIQRWFNDPASRDTLATVQREPCPGAPFVLPSDGLIGLLYHDTALPYNLFKRHSGIDIFGDGVPGEVSVVAAYGGYLTRLPNWKASIIIRHEDPLQPGRIIWTYYTHMASKDGSKSLYRGGFPARYERCLGRTGDAARLPGRIRRRDRATSRAACAFQYRQERGGRQF